MMGHLEIACSLVLLYIVIFLSRCNTAIYICYILYSNTKNGGCGGTIRFLITQLKKKKILTTAVTFLLLCLTMYDMIPPGDAPMDVCRYHADNERCTALAFRVDGMATHSNSLHV